MQSGLDLKGAGNEDLEFKLGWIDHQVTVPLNDHLNNLKILAGLNRSPICFRIAVATATESGENLT